MNFFRFNDATNGYPDGADNDGQWIRMFATLTGWVARYNDIIMFPFYH